MIKKINKNKIQYINKFNIKKKTKLEQIGRRVINFVFKYVIL